MAWANAFLISGDAEFNDAYMLKQIPTHLIKVYMLAKQDQGINVILPENEKKYKQYFFYIFGLWDMVNSDERLIRSSWVDTKLVKKNMASYLTTLSSE